MLTFDNLAKRYDNHTIFEGLRYRAGAGCLVLNDEPGTGKSTLLAVLAGAAAASEGEIRIGDYSLRDAPREAKAALTYVPEDCVGDPRETGRDFLARVAAERRAAVERHALEWADRFGLTPHLDKRFEQMSFGTRKKMFLTSAVLGETRVVLADEPAGGLDAPARAALGELFTALGATRTVLFTTYDAALPGACGARDIAFSDLRRGE